MSKKLLFAVIAMVFKGSVADNAWTTAVLPNIDNSFDTEPDLS
jgi:hypothetical protein